MGYTYTIEYRLDNIEDYDKTEYIDDIPNKKEAKKQAKDILKEYDKRVVLLDIKKYDSEGFLDNIEQVI